MAMMLARTTPAASVVDVLRAAGVSDELAEELAQWSRGAPDDEHSESTRTSAPAHAAPLFTPVLPVDKVNLSGKLTGQLLRCLIFVTRDCELVKKILEKHCTLSEFLLLLSPRLNFRSGAPDALKKAMLNFRSLCSAVGSAASSASENVPQLDVDGQRQVCCVNVLRRW
jgi:hypothetical protein